MKHIEFLAISSIILGLTGCHNIDVSVYGEDENVFITTHRRAINKEVVIHLEIGSVKIPYSNHPEIQIKFPNGDETNLASLDLDMARTYFDEVRISTPSYLSAGHPSKQWTNSGNMEQVFLRSIPLDLYITLFRQDEKTVFAYFRNDSYAEYETSLQIKSGDSDWYSLPLKKEEVVALFGDEKRSYSYGDWQ